MSEEFEKASAIGGNDRIAFLQRKVNRLENEVVRWKREESALRDIERRYLSLLENPLLILMVISGGRIVFLNSVGENFFGFFLRERPRVMLTDFASPGFCSSVEDLLKWEEEKEPWEKRLAFPVRVEDGKEKWLDVAVAPADLAEEDMLLAVAREIPPPDEGSGREGRDAEKIMPAAENISAAFAEEDGVISSMTAGFIKDVLLIWNREPVSGESLFDLAPGGDEGLPFRLAAEKALSGDWAEIGHEAGGKYFVLSFAPVFSPRGEKRGISLAILDKTEQRKAERAARAGEEKFLKLFSLVPDPGLIVTEDGRILECNRTFADRTGIDQDRAVGSSLAELGLISQGELSSLLASSKESLSEGPGSRLRLTLPSGEGLDALISALASGAGKDRVILMTIKVMTDHRADGARDPVQEKKPERAQIPGREEFLKILSGETETAENSRRPLSLILIEIDGFRDLKSSLDDDEMGRFLDDFYQSLKEKIQPGEFLAALGEGEYSILTKAGGYIAHRAAEKVRAMIFHLKLLPEVRLSCSLGVSEFRSEMTPEEFMKRASIALREAKRAGGNRAVLAPAVH
ncbi:MAG: diguanylate cyclase domain-containing protein [Aminivibrio sp.]|jgi:diguanylate cyclase (GGDEF)-like protein/PAS domain S-box-containing protein